MDVYKGMILGLLEIFMIFFSFSYSLQYTNMPKDFGFDPNPLIENATGKPSVFLSLVIFSMLLEPLMYILASLKVFMTRSWEYKADEFCISHGYGSSLH